VTLEAGWCLKRQDGASRGRMVPQEAGLAEMHRRPVTDIGSIDDLSVPT